MTDSLVLAVESVDAARADLVERGVKVSEVFHYADLPFNNSVHNPRISGRDPEDRSYFTFASFEGPDGNGWLLQEVTTRLPGREWDEAGSMDVATLAALLHETSERHDQFEKTHAEHHWWDWYASYLNARQNGNSSDKPTAIWRRSSMFLRDNVARLSLREFYRKLVLGSWELIRVKTVAALPSSKRPGASCESENQAQS